MERIIRMLFLSLAIWVVEVAVQPLPGHFLFWIMVASIWPSQPLLGAITVGLLWFMAIGSMLWTALDFVNHLLARFARMRLK